jgi:UDP:flavonoid glycosyltransferase YjiC (YdhE family)
MRSVQSNRATFFLSAGWGPVVRALPIANRLADYGIPSAFAIGGEIGLQIRAAGFDLIEPKLPPFSVPLDKAAEWWSPYHFLAFHEFDNDTVIAHVEAYRRAISDSHSAVVITDINPLAALAAKSLHVPHITISQSIFLPFRTFHSSEFRLPSALPAINKALARYGVDPLESAEYLDMGAVTFVPSIPEFDPLQNTPSSLHYVGPILGNQLIPLPPTDRSSSTNDAADIFVYPGRPHDTAGSSGQSLLNVVLNALSNLDATVMVATGGHEFEIPEHSCGRLEIVPWQVISSDHKPDLIIHHGGHGACLTAISAGIPSVIIPTHIERKYNARNVAALGCGEFTSLEQSDVHNVRRMIDRVFKNPAYVRECGKWSQTISARNYGGADLVARSIAQMIGS